MKTIKVTDFEEYENEKYGRLSAEYDNSNNSIGGSTNKRFIRLDNKILKPLFKAKQIKNSYVTYIDDFIYENIDKDGNIPLKYISCLFKQERSIMGTNDNIKKDVIGSRLANLFGVPTVYNDIVNYDYRTYLVSVDFVKPGQYLNVCAETYEDTAIDDFSTFKEWEDYLRLKVGSAFVYSKTSERGSDKHQAETKDKFIRDFVPHYMFRNMMIDDSDFKPRNLNYITEIKDGIKNVYLAPSNDYEFAMTYRTTKLMQENMRENMEYLCQNYPEETSKFVENIKKRLYKNNQLSMSKIHKIFTEVEKDEDYIATMEDRLLLNINTMVEEYDRIREGAIHQV